MSRDLDRGQRMEVWLSRYTAEDVAILFFAVSDNLLLYACCSSRAVHGLLEQDRPGCVYLVPSATQSLHCKEPSTAPLTALHEPTQRRAVPCARWQLPPPPGYGAWPWLHLHQRSGDRNYVWINAFKVTWATHHGAMTAAMPPNR